MYSGGIGEVTATAGGDLGSNDDGSDDDGGCMDLCGKFGKFVYS